MLTLSHSPRFLALSLGLAFTVVTSPALAQHSSHDHHNAPPSAAGKPAPKGAAAARTVQVVVDEAGRFNPTSVTVKAGETVRFFIKNEAKQRHEFAIGTVDELKEHSGMMQSMPDMAHADGSMIALKPGQRGAVTWTFDKPGSFHFGCTVKGHLDAGMLGAITVTP